jgi:hypothetical protein
LEPEAKVTVKRPEQSLKQRLEIVSIDEGMQMDRSAEQEDKPRRPKVEMRQPASNVKNGRVSGKLRRAIVSIDEEIQR